MPSPWLDEPLDPADVERLFDIAGSAIVDGLGGRSPRIPATASLPDELQRPVDNFVTLTVGGALNGCIGGIDGGEPLGVSVAHHAWSAAFTDPRLPALRADEYEHLMIEISLLSPLEPVPASSREELLANLRPGVDGLLVSAYGRRALFLPAVWEQLPVPDDFLDHLLMKAGLAPRPWPPGMRAHRFTARRYARKAGQSSSSAA